jgi:hypothetical protein
MEGDHTNVILFLAYLPIFLGCLGIIIYSVRKRKQMNKLPPDPLDRVRRQDFDEHRP